MKHKLVKVIAFVFLFSLVLNTYAITGGSVVDNSNPLSKYLVSINYDNGDPGGDNGSGVIIASNMIITAAHVFAPYVGQYKPDASKITVRFGSDGNKPEKTMKAKAVYSNPDYFNNVNDYETLSSQGLHDLAVVVLDGNIPDGYTPVGIAKSEDVKKIIDSKTDDVYILGYGSTLNGTENKKKLSLGIAAIHSFGTVKDALNIYSNEIDKSSNTYVHCAHGDSGGPALVKDGNNYLLIGLVEGNNSPNGTTVNENSKDNDAISAGKNIVFWYTSTVDPGNYKWINGQIAQYSSVEKLDKGKI